MPFANFATTMEVKGLILVLKYRVLKAWHSQVFGHSFFYLFDHCVQLCITWKVSYIHNLGISTLVLNVTQFNRNW